MYLTNVQVNRKEIDQKIKRADIIYVGGGNVSYMMEIWKKYSVDKALIGAYTSGKVLAGLSGGSICWFIAGHSGSEFLEEQKNPNYKWVKGLGIIPYLHCPHYDEPERMGFDNFFSGQVTDAIALENQVAFAWENNKINIIKSNPNKNGYRLSWSDSGLSKKILF